MKRTTSQRTPAFAAILTAAILGFGLAAAAWAGPGRAISQTTEPARVEVEDGSAMQIAIDPQTGAIRQPTAEERRQLDKPLQSLASSATAAAPSSQVVFPNGAVGMSAGPEFLNVWVVVVNPDGSVTQGCVQGMDTANAIVNGSSALEEK